MKFFSVIIATSFAATAMACDAANCCYKNTLTCVKHNTVANVLTANAFCKDQTICDQSITANCKADCCRLIKFPEKSFGIPC
ncbi:hypothetical protein EJ02DRAFT_438051 [Clathrospora elynae]|uniref:Extracellular membrane protein CFEM domain-containing protein n=1 Tax=Clathrospora elynae TaxID=706981 RepID=A0A6A5SB04_9PLEO|nr:hypothetical protein EJ02DRAFT_460581 [Clathrospora elynae]KAF1937182.1 hypothetical protein EJ02DRAFT_438051 [Clathrospora elynae]